MIIYNAFHSIGLFSVFDTDIISNADIYTGGFSGRYGGRISSIMDISTRDGSLSGLSGRIGASPFGSKLLLEGPLGKRNERGGHLVHPQRQAQLPRAEFQVAVQLHRRRRSSVQLYGPLRQVDLRLEVQAAG